MSRHDPVTAIAGDGVTIIGLTKGDVYTLVALHALLNRPTGLGHDFPVNAVNYGLKTLKELEKTP